MHTLKNKAKIMQGYLTQAKRGETEIPAVKNGSPEWVTRICRAARAKAKMLPDDIRYQYIDAALDVLQECENESRYVEDSYHEYINGMVDIYTSDLTAWLHSRTDRMEYVNQARTEFGAGDSLEKDLMTGQYLERREVFDIVKSELEDLDDALLDSEGNVS